MWAQSSTPAMFSIPACAPMSANDPSQPPHVHASTSELANAASRFRNIGISESIPAVFSTVVTLPSGDRMTSLPPLLLLLTVAIILVQNHFILRIVGGMRYLGLLW